MAPYQFVLLQELTLLEQTQPLYQVLVRTKIPLMPVKFSVLSRRQTTKQELSTDLFCSTGLLTTVHCKVAVKPSQYLLTSQLHEAMKCIQCAGQVAFPYISSCSLLAVL